ncbi:MAG TPA: hypothetical protein VFI54_12820 [Solirubrobacteraceae bacterium]|nr:hypothetical protein [Solirubrobacteraceae bacterium]
MRPRSPAVIAAATLLAVCLLAAAPASARVSKPVIDCNTNSRLTHTYTEAQLRTALNTMPADIKEYTNCYDVIQRALLAEIGGIKADGGGTGGGGSSFLPTPLLIVLGVLVVGAGVLAVIARRRAPS